MSLDDLMELCSPPRSVREVDWRTVESSLGTELPRDYKDLASSYGPGAFCDFIHVFHPHAATAWVDLTGPVPATVRRQLQQDRDHGTHPVPHNPQRLFTIGVTDNGEYLFWITEPVSKPNAWRIAVNEARGPRWFTYDGSLTTFLTDVLSGRAAVPMFPADLLEHGVTFTPSPPRHGNKAPEQPRPSTASVPTNDIRDWARANGYQVPDRGRIPANIIDAWREANSPLP